MIISRSIYCTGKAFGCLNLNFLRSLTLIFLAFTSHDFPTNKKRWLWLTQWLKLGVTVMSGGKGGVLVHDYFPKKYAHFGETWTFSKIVIFWRTLPLRLASNSKKNCDHAQSSFEFPIPRAISSKFSGKRMSQSLIPISSGFKELTIADRRYIHLQLAV